MGWVGDCFDNIGVELFWTRMHVELLNSQKWHTRIELANAIFEYLEIFHNRQLTPPNPSNIRVSDRPGPVHRAHQRHGGDRRCLGSQMCRAPAAALRQVPQEVTLKADGDPDAPRGGLKG